MMSKGMLVFAMFLSLIVAAVVLFTEVPLPTERQQAAFVLCLAAWLYGLEYRQP